MLQLIISDNVACEDLYLLSVCLSLSLSLSLSHTHLCLLHWCSCKVTVDHIWQSCIWRLVFSFSLSLFLPPPPPLSLSLSLSGMDIFLEKSPLKLVWSKGVCLGFFPNQLKQWHWFFLVCFSFVLLSATIGIFKKMVVGRRRRRRGSRELG